MTVDALPAPRVSLALENSAQLIHFVTLSLGSGRGIMLTFLLNDKISPGTRREVTKTDTKPVWVRSMWELGMGDPEVFEEDSARALLTASNMKLDPLAEAVLIPRICSHLEGFMDAGSAMLAMQIMIQGDPAWYSKTTINKLSKLCAKWSQEI